MATIIRGGQTSAGKTGVGADFNGPQQQRHHHQGYLWLYQLRPGIKESSDKRNPGIRRI